MNNLVLLTIIAEEALLHLIEEQIEMLGARGYTTSSVSGKGLTGVRNNQWEGENVKIETIVTEKSCAQILEYLQKNFFDRYAMIAFYHPVSVVRTQHFI